MQPRSIFQVVWRLLIGKSLYPLFMNIPGIRMAAPTTPYDAKACLTWLTEDENPGIVRGRFKIISIKPLNSTSKPASAKMKAISKKASDY